MNEEKSEVVPTIEVSVEGNRWSVAASLISICVMIMVVCGFVSWILVEMIRSK